jgi:hypothetical protein
MRQVTADPDATIILARKLPRPNRGRMAAVAAAALGLAVTAAALLALAPRAPTLPPLADEPAILAAQGDHLTLFRFTPAPTILVAVFPSMHAQALALDRAAAFIEKSGFPADRVVPEPTFRAMLAARNENFDTFYVGHDYRIADLAAFYTQADRDGVALGPEELALQHVIAGVPDARALITLPANGAGGLDADAHAAVLSHELAHGAYFTNPAYAAYVTRFWAETMNEAERQAFRAYLGRKGYRTANEDLMQNETQAYLAFTPDTRLFSPRRVAIGADGVAALRSRFIAGLPDGWLRARAGS